jgi:D-alanyl-D-alanine-carboxypeptidase/D-alanyl-D-alanine-endopeptidase
VKAGIGKVLAGMVLLAASATLSAQQQLALQNAEARGAYIFSHSAVTGMELVVVRNHELWMQGYGETFPGSRQAPDAHSLIRLCSVSKIFTTDLLMQLDAAGKLRLNDPLQRFAPPGVAVPKRPGARPITLLDLATHTSGLPREVGPYPANTPHFTFPDHAYRWSWLPKQRLMTPPGTAALYSNIGFDLLGDALATAAGTSYTRLLNDRILRPLGLHDTTLTPNSSQCARLLRGTGDQGPCTDTQASGPSGGIYSTPADMGRFMQSLLQAPGLPAQPQAPMEVYLKPSQLRSMQGLSHAGDPTGIGLAWIQLGDGPSALVEKTGGGAGFQTYLALNLKRHTGIFVAVTDGAGHAQIDFYHEANTLLADLAGVPAVPPRVRTQHPSGRHRSGRKRHNARDSAPH